MTGPETGSKSAYLARRQSCLGAICGKNFLAESRGNAQTMIRKIISGGQTGADRAALDWTIKDDIPHGGWCPAGRRAEDGVIPERYRLQETRAQL